MKILKVLGWLFLIVIGVLALWIAWAMIAYTPQYVMRVLAWQESDAFDWQKFPFHPLYPSPELKALDEAPDPRVAQLFSELAGVEDWEQFLENNHTQSFIVIQDGKVVYENYFNGTQRDSIVTSFSAAKSFTSALIGLAIQEGYIQSVDEPITNYLPELAERDPRFEQITIRHLLMMSSGLDYQEIRPLLFNSDDPLTTYHPDQRKLALEETRIINPPGKYFSYNKYHPQLLGMILERATGMTVTEYLQSRIWDPAGMEYGGSWSTDSEASDFEKMETGVNARAIDFARFGMLFLNGGAVNGKQVISKEWVEESTSPQEYPQDYWGDSSEWFASMPGKGYYKYMWWGLERGNGEYDYSARGDKGQSIYVSPSKNLVIARNGIDFGLPANEWLKLFYDFTTQY